METLATFRLLGEAGLTAQAVTVRLGIEPSKSFESGTPVSSRSPKLRETSAWMLRSSSEIQKGVELKEQLGRLLAVLEPHEADLWDLVRQGYWANWFCYVASNPAEHAVELDRDLLVRLLRLPGDVWLDVCGDV